MSDRRGYTGKTTKLRPPRQVEQLVILAALVGCLIMLAINWHDGWQQIVHFGAAAIVCVGLLLRRTFGRP
jgi:hypothetical protein